MQSTFTVPPTIAGIPPISGQAQQGPIHKLGSTRKARRARHTMSSLPKSEDWRRDVSLWIFQTRPTSSPSALPTTASTCTTTRRRLSDSNPYFTHDHGYNNTGFCWNDYKKCRKERAGRRRRTASWSSSRSSAGKPSGPLLLESWRQSSASRGGLANSVANGTPPPMQISQPSGFLHNQWELESRVGKHSFAFTRVDRQQVVGHRTASPRQVYHFPTRTDNCVKNHLYSRLRKNLRRVKRVIAEHSQ